MKTIISIVIVVALLAGGWFAFNRNATKETATNNQVVTTAIPGASVVLKGNYSIITEESIINWEAEKPLITGYVHRGTIGFKDGTVSVTDATSTGTFTIDMNTIKLVSLGGGKAGKESALETHLKSKDFFEVAKFPTGVFTISEVVSNPDSATSLTYMIKGTLTMKDKTNPVEFPATIYLKDGKLHAEGSLSIDRTKWGIAYGSASVFSNLANNAIGDQVKLTLAIIATAKPQIQ